MRNIRITYFNPTMMRILVVMFLVTTACSGGSYIGGDAHDVERKHGVKLPASASDFETVGDKGVVVWTNIDRGYTSVFTIDSADVDLFVESLPQGESLIYADYGGPPSNSQYQPTALHWDAQLEPMLSVTKDSPAGGDFLTVEMYRIDGDRVGVLLYSDWN